MTEIEFRVFETHEFRVDEGQDGTFEGVACQYGKKDSYGTTFHPGVFKRGIDKGSYAYLFMHSPYDPIGTFRADEQPNHLHIAGAYDDTQAGRDKRAMARSGSARELSVGFVRTDLPEWKKLAEMGDEDRAEVLENIRSARLVEVSQITARMAAVPGSKLKVVRSARSTQTPWASPLSPSGWPSTTASTAGTRRSRISRRCGGGSGVRRCCG